MSSYFKYLPNFQYINRNKDSSGVLGEYLEVKNLFKRSKLLDDIFNDLNYFKKYSIIGDERPDQVAEKFYGNSSLDWIILLSNNILNIQSEWPLPQIGFNNYLLRKYGSYENLNKIHHYESREIRSSSGIVILPAGVRVSIDYQLEYYDSSIDKNILVSNVSIPITNYQYEEKLDNKKRNIYVLKPKYLQIVINDLESIMKYKEGGTQYVSPTLKKADNIKIYE